MAKKPPAGEASAEAARKRRPPQKKTKKKVPAKPARKAAPARKARETPAQAELPIVDVDVVEDADIIAESPVETTLVSTSSSAVPEAGPAPDDSDDDDDGDDDGEASAPSQKLSAEEQELSELYGEDLVKPAIVHSEYSDRQTADEDRPMVPEINAREERKHQWQERRERRRQRRDERDRQRQERREHNQSRPGSSYDSRPGSSADSRPASSADSRPGSSAGPSAGPSASYEARGDRGEGGRAAEPRQQYQTHQAPRLAAPATNGADHDALARVGTPLGDAAATVFAQLRNGQPLPVRQLAAMMRKRSLVETDPEQLWPQLKAELLGDERSYRTLGLRPRIVYRGRDLFAPGPVAMSQTADAEANVAAALSRLAGATHRALAARIAKASGAGFERLIHAYLVAAGYRDIAWVKRIGGIAYASAIAPGIDRTVLISARSGDQPIDRRGIGELRVGVEAKDLVAGILFSARELSEDAERELERAGRSIAVICGDQLVAALIASGVGVVSAAAPLHYVDDQLLDELLAG
jgi:Restriction endonuclease